MHILLLKIGSLYACGYKSKLIQNIFALFHFHNETVETWCAVTVFTKPVCSPRSHLQDRQCKRPVWASALPLTPPPAPPVQTKQFYLFQLHCDKAENDINRIKLTSCKHSNTIIFPPGVTGMAVLSDCAVDSVPKAVIRLGLVWWLWQSVNNIRLVLYSQSTVKCSMCHWEVCPCT